MVWPPGRIFAERGLSHVSTCRRRLAVALGLTSKTRDVETFKALRPSQLTGLTGGNPPVPEPWWKQTPSFNARPILCNGPITNRHGQTRE